MLTVIVTVHVHWLNFQIHIILFFNQNILKTRFTVSQLNYNQLQLNHWGTHRNSKYFPSIAIACLIMLFCVILLIISKHD